MKRYFSVAMLIVGTIIGAGFASGREIVSFFGENISPLIAVLCGVLIFLLSVMFLKIGSRLNYSNVGEVNKAMTGKMHLIVDIFLLVNSFIVLGGMLAGMDSLGAIVLDIKPVYSVVSGLLCVFVVIKGMKGLLDCNRIVVPVIIIVLVLTCALKLSKEGTDISGVSLTANSSGIVLVYVCMNMMLAATVLTTMGKMSDKEIYISSGIAAFVMTALMLLLIYSVSGTKYASADMPLLEMSKALGTPVFALVIIAIAVSIFTTMLTAMSGLTSWFSSIFGSKIFSASVVLLAGLALANIGFTNVVGYLYPVIGVLGLVYTLFGIIFIPKTRVLSKPRAKPLKGGNGKVHKRRKSAQNDG